MKTVLDTLSGIYETFSFQNKRISMTTPRLRHLLYSLARDASISKYSQTGIIVLKKNTHKKKTKRKYKEKQRVLFTVQLIYLGDLTTLSHQPIVKHSSNIPCSNYLVSLSQLRNDLPCIHKQYNLNALLRSIVSSVNIRKYITRNLVNKLERA